MNLKNAIAHTLIIVFTADHLASQDAPEKELTQSLSSKVTEVTVYADRARVTRESVVDLPPKLKRVSFSKLPSWIDEGSVRVSLRLEGAAKGARRCARASRRATDTK